MHPTIRRWIATSLSILIFFGTLSSAHAGMVGNDALQARVELLDQRQQLRNTLADSEVRSQLINLGADITSIDQRVDHLTLTELQQLNSQIEQAPAGAGAAGLIALILLVLLITDLVGATDVFPFINPIDRR